MKIRILLLALSLFLPEVRAYAASPELVGKLDALMTGSAVQQRTHLALHVVDAETGEVIYDRDGGKLFTPASVLKLYTSACALSVLGPQRRFSTEAGISGFISGPSLRGDLVVHAGGDPMYTHDDLKRLAGRVRDELHLDEINGDVVIDTSLFATPLKGPGWMWDDDPDAYNMSITAMMVDFNVLNVVVQPAIEQGRPAKVRLFPESGYPPVAGEIITVDPETPSDYIITRRPFTDPIILSGIVSNADKPSTTILTMQDPALWSASVLKRYLEDAGVHVSGNARTSRERIAVDPLLIQDSVPLLAAVKHFNKVSENAIGEMLLHQLAINAGNVPATWPDGAAAISQWLTGTVGLDGGSFRLVDGSGLSRYDLASPESATGLLRYMYNDILFDAYRDTLPIASVKMDEAGEKVVEVSAKPGGMAGVATWAGYVKAGNGRWLCFAFFSNGYIGENDAIRALRDDVLRALILGKPME